jgi:hypothetical protein
MSFHKLWLISLIFFQNQIYISHEHGYLSEPLSRASAWLTDKDFVQCCRNYDYNQMYCGGKMRQWIDNGGRCGICGDPFDGEREYERNGSKYLGKIVKNYTRNSVIPVKIQVRALKCNQIIKPNPNPNWYGIC